MSNYFYANLGPGSAPSLVMTAVNKGDANLYLRVTGVYTLTPGTRVKAIIVPSGMTSLPDPVESFSVTNLLKRLRGDKTYYDTTYGMFSVPGGENNTDTDIKLSFSDIQINDNYWENKNFNLHWILQLGTTEVYASTSGVYTLPHNIQNTEVVISGYPLSSNTMQYAVKWNAIANASDTNYGAAPTDGPYKFRVNYAWNSGVAVSGTISNWRYYPASTMSSGIYFTLPYMDERTSYNTPAIYNFFLSNVSAAPSKPLTTDKIIQIDHQKFTDSENYFRNLDEQVFTSPDPGKLKWIDDVKIEPGVINRKRLSIGINDVAIKDNTYSKQGMYVSSYYPLDFNLYTFSLKTKEFIPDYPGLNAYDVIQYFVELNSKWERISPINRGDEFNNSIPVPKILVFDKGQTNETQVKYIELSNVNVFRIKIVFDLSKLTDAKFIPPEVSDYKCIIFDKDQLNEL